MTAFDSWGPRDADLEIAGLESTARRERRLKKLGFCCHGWTGPVEIGKAARVCRDCGEVFTNDVHAAEARREALI